MLKCDFNKVASGSVSQWKSKVLNLQNKFMFFLDELL